jgi:hypothetical protein
MPNTGLQINFRSNFRAEHFIGIALPNPNLNNKSSITWAHNIGHSLLAKLKFERIAPGLAGCGIDTNVKDLSLVRKIEPLNK